MRLSRWCGGITLLMLLTGNLFAVPYLVVHRSSGPTVIPLARVKKITFTVDDTGTFAVNKLSFLKSVTAVITSNPVAAVIDYSLEKKGHVRVEVFDLRGRSVRILKSAYEPAGRYRLQWKYTGNNGKRVSAGPYIARVRIDGATYSETLHFIP